MLRRLPPHLVAFGLVVACALSCALVTASRVGATDKAGELQTGIDSSRDREKSLAAAAARLAKLERATARDVMLLQGRVAAAQADLERATTLAAQTQQRLVVAQRRVRRLRARLAQVRVKLSALLRERYASDRPDLVTVVLNSDGFSSLLETMAFLQRVERSDTELLALVREARADAGREQKSLVRLTAQRQSTADAVLRRRNALAGISAGLQSRRALLARARAARLASLRTTRASRVRAERELERLLAERRQAAGQDGPGGPWAIPWAIVQCESGGQNLPPNSAGASGYYQMLDTTWAGLGGSTTHAFEAPKAEQDRLASKLWAGGAGTRNWVCASLVGFV